MLNYRLCRNPLEFFELMWKFARVTPTLPQWGRQPKGASPLDPMNGWIFLHAAEVRSTAMLHGASPDEAVSTRGPIVNPIPFPSLVF
jgi:hypothetical protein